MLPGILLLLIGSLLLVALPGWALVNALLPRPASLRPLERAYLAIAGGLILVITVGIILGFLPADGTGHLQTLATGAPTAELAMLAVTAVLFWVGLLRGAYPRVAARFPQLLAMGPGKAERARDGP